MRECGVEVKEWVDKLFPRLSEKLCIRIVELKDEDASYDEVKGALLRAVGETVTTYGHCIFEMSGETLKAKSADEIVDVISRNCRGLFQDAKSVEDCVFALAMAITRHVIPSEGKVFLENKTMSNLRELRDGWNEWMSGRAKGNFYRMLGGSGDHSCQLSKMKNRDRPRPLINHHEYY